MATSANRNKKMMNLWDIPCLPNEQNSWLHPTTWSLKAPGFNYIQHWHRLRIPLLSRFTIRLVKTPTLWTSLLASQLPSAWATQLAAHFKDPIGIWTALQNWIQQSATLKLCLLGFLWTASCTFTFQSCLVWSAKVLSAECGYPFCKNN